MIKFIDDIIWKVKRTDLSTFYSAAHVKVENNKRHRTKKA